MPAASTFVSKQWLHIRTMLFRSHGSVLDTISSHENNYNIIRVILAASVIWFHAAYIAGVNRPDLISRLLRPITDLGGLAVQCFFFLSGLFVAQSLHKDPNLIDFSIKRIMRIFPGLFACLVITTILLSIATHGLQFWRPFFIPETYGYILGNSVLDLQWSIPTLIANNPSTTINGSIHTLNTEVKMYALLAMLGLIGAATRKFRLAMAALLVLVAMAIAGGAITALFQAPSDAYAMIMMFMTGVLAFAMAAKIQVNLAQALGLLGLFFVTGSMLRLHSVAFYAMAIWAMFFVGQLPMLRRLLQPKVDPSYGIYIYGWPCEQLIKTCIPSAKADAITLSAIVLAYVLARFSWRYVEKPCMEIAKAIARNRASAKPFLAAFHSRPSWHISLYGLLAALTICIAMRCITDRFNLLPVQMMVSRIVDFGPHEASVKTGFSVQLDGSSALWIRTDTAPPKDSRIVFGGHRLETLINAASLTLTANVPRAMIRKPGTRQIYLRGVSPDGILESNAVSMKLEP